MSRFASKSLHLDIACHQCSLSDGMPIPLPRPLKPGSLDEEALNALTVQLGDLFSEIGARSLTLSLSDLLARSWIIERPDGLQSPSEIAPLARLQLQSIYGESDTSAAEWMIEVDTLPFTRRWPAVALPKKLVDSVIGTAARHHVTLSTVQPRFVHALNQHASRLLQLIKPARTTVHVLDTPDCITLGIQQAGQWLSLRTHPPLSALGIDQATLIRRECRAVNVAVDACRINLLPWPNPVEPAQQKVRS